MSTDPTNPGSSTPEVPLTPTITAYQQIAEPLFKDVETLTAAIPDLQVHHPAITPFVRKHQNVPNDFVSTTVAVSEQTPALQGVLEPSASRSDLQYIDAFKPLLARIGALYDALDYTIQTKKASLSVAALQAYVIAKGFARNPSDTITLTHVADMQRDLGRKGIGRKKTPKSSDTSASTSTPTPQPPTPSTEA